jgi:hypothetical protein
MASINATKLARGVLLLGAIALALMAAMNATRPQALWLAASPEIHLVVLALFGNLLFTAFPFRRRGDLALALAVVMIGIDISAHTALQVGIADAAGVGLAVLPVWTERVRARARRTHADRRQPPAWKSAIGNGQKRQTVSAPLIGRS